MNKENKLATKDFITCGIFSAISLIFMLISTIANLTPHTMLFYAPLAALLNGVLYILIVVKIKKRGVVLLFSIIPALFLLISGVEGIITGLSVLIAALISEAILWNDKVRFWRIAYSYIVYSTLGLAIGGSFRMFTDTANYLDGMLKSGLDANYVEQLYDILTYSNWILNILGTIVSALIGICFGRFILKRHLEKAGIL
ncbi:MptD family putative ECF transporter S component [Alkalibaculum sp. M08DMB]|uniref:MptD family putative ECF transporter S component n=1 Tax=Alkalibaculum sporogenes TaxID=2655001 RepID=A0A6A7K839_9FIRM|nr:MptD family putative ECF transporter S component [Alkalibaculum sporogenes]MPW25491.1 MptD family putative ECF transporter S component [Alkalibaculum sporogenes]